MQFNTTAIHLPKSLSINVHNTGQTQFLKIQILPHNYITHYLFCWGEYVFGKMSKHLQNSGAKQDKFTFNIKLI